MLERLRRLWAERPGLIAAVVIAPIVFAVTLAILFVAVGGGDDADAPQQSVSEAPVEEEAQAQQAQRAPQQATVIVQTSAEDEQDNASADEPAAAAEQSQNDLAPDEQSQDEAQQEAAEAPAEQPEQQEAAKPAPPRMVREFAVMPLEDVFEVAIDEDELRHGTDGSEGGILPIDNGVVVSSREQDRTSWELIVPSAGLKSSIVKVGRTETGAMGSPDNPYVIGWLDSSATPGELGNALLAGHRDFEDVSGNVGTGVCWELVNTEVGDQMIVRDNERNIYYVYTVTEASTVNPRDPASARYLKNTEESVITLITCEGSFNAETHQYSHRRVVVGVLSAVASPDA